MNKYIKIELFFSFETGLATAEGFKTATGPVREYTCGIRDMKIY